MNQPQPSRRTFQTLLGMGAFSFLASKGLSAAVGPKAATQPLADEPSPFQFTPFTRDLPIPVTKTPLARIPGALPATGLPFIPGDCRHGIAPEFATRPAAWQRHPLHLYEIDQRESVAEIVPGVQTPIWGYDGLFPGPTLRARLGEPFVVRFKNSLSHATSIHYHGGHSPAHADGYPNFYVDPGEARDYYYPNILPQNPDGTTDAGDAPSTNWYHDHAMDEAAHNVLYGLAGFYLVKDDLEAQLEADRVLPSGEFDIPMSFADRRLRADGSLWFDPLDHNGYLGDIHTVNGIAQPRLRVQRRKYRFRFLDGANARYYLLRLSAGVMVRIGNDGHLLPAAQAASEVFLAPGKRADVIIDFRNAPNTVYLNNHLQQTGGRGPDGSWEQPRLLDAPVPMLRFDVVGAPVQNDATVVVGTPLRPFREITDAEIVRTRRFRFHRSNGAWKINDKFFDEFVAEAVPELGTAERWIFENGSGGWWHPVHVHLEAHQIVRHGGKAPRAWERYSSDISVLGPNDSTEVKMRFRTFSGPFVMHCHAVEHEDMRMMLAYDPRVTGRTGTAPIGAYYP